MASLGAVSLANVTDDVTQRVTEQVAMFKLVPRRMRDVDARLRRASPVVSATGSAPQKAAFADARAAIDKCNANWRRVNPQVDQVLSAVADLQRGVRRPGLGDVAAISNAALLAANVMRDADSAEVAVTNFEQSVLTPAQRAAVHSSSLTPMIAIAIGAWLVWKVL